MPFRASFRGDRERERDIDTSRSRRGEGDRVRDLGDRLRPRSAAGERADMVSSSSSSLPLFLMKENQSGCKSVRLLWTRWVGGGGGGVSAFGLNRLTWLFCAPASTKL